MKSSENHIIDARESDYLYTAVSQLTNSGTGLYTAIHIYRGEVIAKFKGKILTDAQADARINKGLDKYFIEMPDGTIMDSMNSKCFAKYANDALGFPGSGFRNNATIRMDDDDSICLFANRNIKPGEEIFCAYGRRYWKKHG